MVKRRYGIFDKKDRFIQLSEAKIYYHFERIRNIPRMDEINSLSLALYDAFGYTLGKDWNNIVIALDKKATKIIVYEMANKENTLKEFYI